MNPREELNKVFLEIARSSGDKIITKTIPFLNNDVPKFLEELAKCEKWMRETGGEIEVKNQTDYSRPSYKAA